MSERAVMKRAHYGQMVGTKQQRGEVYLLDKLPDSRNCQAIWAASKQIIDLGKRLLPHFCWHRFASRKVKLRNCVNFGL